MLVRRGHTSNFKGAATTALATGVGTVGAGAAIASAGVVGISSSGAVAAAATVAMPVVGVLVGFGISRAIRSGRESKFKRAMATCLGEYGYSVENWSKLHKHDDAARIAADNAKVYTSTPSPKGETTLAPGPEANDKLTVDQPGAITKR